MAVDDADVLDDLAALLAAARIEDATVERIVVSLRGRWGGGSSYIRAIDRRLRDRQIRAALESGQPVTRLARQSGVSVSTIRRKKSEWFG